MQIILFNMPQKNLHISIPGNYHNMPILLYKGRFIIALAAALILLLSSCKKISAALGSQSQLETLFEQNILNHDFVVHFASDNGMDITSRFNGYTFVLTKTTSFYDGPMTAKISGITYTGTWTSNSDYSKLSINITSPSIPAPFVFLNDDWKFTKKAFPIMELAPWGSTDPKVLHMLRL